MKEKRILYFVFLFFVLAVIITIVIKYMGMEQQEEETSPVQNHSTVVQPTSETEITTQAINETEETKETEPKEYQSPIDFEDLKTENPDTVGWIRIPDTKIDYPILQTTDNDHYLHTNFEGKESKYGSIYLDYESDSDMSGYNNVLYGHNMRDGSMFKDVVRFKDETYFKEHQYFEIYTPERTIHLKAVSCYYDEAKSIARKTKFSDQEAFEQFVLEMLEPCAYAEIPDVQISSLYVLITCSYEIDDARTFLFAVEVDENQQYITTTDIN